MNNLIIRSYHQFENFCVTEFSQEERQKSYNITIDSSLEDEKNIIELCRKAIRKDAEHFNFINALNLCFIAKVRTIEELMNIEEIFPEEMERILRKAELNLDITLCHGQSIDVLKVVQYDVYDYLLSIFSTVKFTVSFLKDYDETNLIIIDNLDDSIRYNNEFFNENLNENKTVIVNIDFKNNDFDMGLLHKCMLICSKYKELCKGFIVNISSGDLFRVRTFVSYVLCESIFVICRNRLIFHEKSSVGKLPPATYIENVSDLMFFQQPLKKEAWDKLISNVKEKNQNGKTVRVNANTFGTGFECEKKFWSYLRLCEKFLFEEFDGNKSVEYTKLRIAAYSSDEFYNEYVSKIPFLALFIFSVYDNFYRSNLLLKFKKDCGRKNYHLGIEDFVLSQQGKQESKIFKIYKEKKKKYDIKNLLTTYNVDNNGNSIIKFHKTVVAEIFESISISEGLLQIMENAVLHAHSGLLSLRVYNRTKGLETKAVKKENHIEYLDSMYSPKYFRYKDADFYLEVQLSDISDKSISQKFVENIEMDTARFLEMLENLSWTKEKFDDIKKSLNTKYFFSNSLYIDNDIVPTTYTATLEDLKNFKQKYYQIDKNLVHHYGLEIFNSIITSRVGIFSVCGYGDAYDNLNDVFNKVYNSVEEFAIKSSDHIAPFVNEYAYEMYQKIKAAKQSDIESVRNSIQKDKDFSGTTYKILFPLNHSSVTEENIIELSDENDQITQEEWIPISVNKNVEFDVIKKISDKQRNVDKFKNFVVQNWLNSEVRIKKHEFEEKNIELDKKVFVLCLNYPEVQRNTKNDCEHFEEFIKGILLFALSTLRQGTLKKLPIAIVNIDPFQLIEASRIISIYYTKKGMNEDGIFSKMPIYLKCKKSSKEIVFAGDDINEVKNNIIKTAMKNGTMFDELTTIVDILERVNTDFYKNGGDI